MHVLPGAVSIAMEPPHHSFWIEASPDMPDVLKERCIEAYEKIHACGVLHGAVELCHMLIGGDGKVTIINFTKSRALDSNLDVMLLEATPADLELEMRKVKYKLDYDGARKKESEKMLRSEERIRRDGTHTLDALRRGRRAGKAREDISEDDNNNPPISIDDWKKDWDNAAANAHPTRFVVPGQDSDTLGREVLNFLAILNRMAASSSPGKSTRNSNRRQVRFASKISSTRFVNAFPAEESTAPAADTPLHSYGLRKRKLGESSTSRGESHRTKRSRFEVESSISLAPTDDEDDEDVPGRRRLHPDPILVAYMNDQSLDKDRFTPPRTPLAEAADPPSTSPLDPRFPPIKVRDFAYEPYDGPHGYYAPYPLMEAVASNQRRLWIHGEKEKKRTEAALAHPQLVAEGTIGSANAASKRSVSDERLMRLALGLGPVRERTVPEEASASTQKRKRGDQETKMWEDDFIENDRRARKSRRMSESANRITRQLSIQPSFYPRDDEHVQERAVSQQDRVPSGSRAEGTMSSDRAVTNGPIGSSKRLTIGERMAFATLGRPLSSSRNASHSTSVPSSSSTRNVRPSATRINNGDPPRRKKTDYRGQSSKLRRKQSSVRSQSPSSEEEVEALLFPSPTDKRHLLFDPLKSCVDFLLQWIQ